ncbi:hypothetical protein ABW21_db0203998 [Orbilia brochopaga]|nr:hypothetical protein ABW21_db0203998 [Drechslerella brochopaga]
MLNPRHPPLCALTKLVTDLAASIEKDDGKDGNKGDGGDGGDNAKAAMEKTAPEVE